MTKKSEKRIIGNQDLQKRKFWRSNFMCIEEMKNVDIRTVDPESLVSVNFLTYTTCIKKARLLK